MEEIQIAKIQRWAAAVVMERIALTNRWVSEKWEAKCVVPDLDPQAEPRVVQDSADLTQIIFPGLQIVLRRDEVEGYQMNITSPEPKIFVLWRMHEAVAKPEMLTVSYNEGARWMDSDESVDSVPLPVELVPWIARYCEQNYRPEPRKKPKYATNKDKGRMGNWRPD